MADMTSSTKLTGRDRYFIPECAVMISERRK
jgi:hypothetical protein